MGLQTEDPAAQAIADLMELEKTDLYAKLYRQQEEITREQLSVFAVSSKTP